MSNTSTSDIGHTGQLLGSEVAWTWHSFVECFKCWNYETKLSQATYRKSVFGYPTLLHWLYIRRAMPNMSICWSRRYNTIEHKSNSFHMNSKMLCSFSIDLPVSCSTCHAVQQLKVINSEKNNKTQVFFSIWILNPIIRSFRYSEQFIWDKIVVNILYEMS